MMGSENDGGTMSQNKYDELEVAKLKRELLETPQIFVLNNLLMSVMFFENFERDKHRLMHSSRTTLHNELSPTLLRDETIERVVPDIVFEIVNRNVRFSRLHGPKKTQIEPLVPKRMYIINDNIEVLESKHNPQYSTAYGEKPSYQAVVENLDNHQGFVKLKCAPSQARQIAQPDEPETYEPQPGPSTRPDDDEIYEYSTIASVNTPRPLDIVSCERRDTLPKTCFTSRKLKKYDEKTDDSEEDDDGDYEEEPVKEELFETVTYISSSGFMQHFQNALFPNSLGQALGFDLSEINLAKAIPGKIFCNLQDVDEDFSQLSCEVIPSIAIQWPIELTFEFHDRAERPIMRDKFGEEYRWPKDNMISDIRSLNCVLVPRGYIPKRGENPDFDIEWEVGFPKAQRYLDTHMSHTQMRAFLFLLTIYKSHIEPVNNKYDGLLIDHLRTHMYWECESNPRDWPEHRLGSKLVLVIKSFMQRLSTAQLPDFIIKRKNTFLNVPNKHLNHAQKVFHDVLQSPAVYFISSLRNLRYCSPRFYPQLDLKELYAILTATSASFIHPTILNMKPPNLTPKNRKPINVDGDTNYRKEIRWKIKVEKINRERFIQKRHEEEMKEENLKTEKRGSVDSIDLSWEAESQFDMFKTRALLRFFIRHFIEMAKKSRRLSTPRQALFYLKQATYLTRILEDFGLEADARELQDVITREEDMSKKISVSESFKLPPSTPKRNSSGFNGWDITQQVKGNNINLNNLNKSYNSTAIPNVKQLRKHPSNLKIRPPSVLRNSNFQNEDRKSGDMNVRRSVVGFSDSVERF